MENIEEKQTKICTGSCKEAKTLDNFSKTNIKNPMVNIKAGLNAKNV